jgi:hypothetical protein
MGCCNCKCGGQCVCGVCCGCNPCPPPYCGCIPIADGETCLNQTYYFYVYQNEGSTPCDNVDLIAGDVYYEFSFGYVIFIPVSGGPSLEDCLTLFFQMYFYCQGILDINIDLSALTVTSTPPPAGLTCAGTGKAANCYMWYSDYSGWDPYAVDLASYLNPFTVSGIVDCNSEYPNEGA